MKKNRVTRKKQEKRLEKNILHVEYEEKRIDGAITNENKLLLQAYRQEQAPFVKAFVQEMKKRMEQKKVDKRMNLIERKAFIQPNGTLDRRTTKTFL